MFKNALYLITMVSLCCVTGCSSDHPASGAPKKSPGHEATIPRQVDVIPAVEEKVTRGTIVTGTLAAEDQVVLSFKVPGRLSELTVDLGSRVQQGQMIAQLDPTDYRLRLRQTEAVLQQARARLGLALEGTEDRIEPEHTPVVRQARAMLNEAQRNHQRNAELWEEQLVAHTELEASETAKQVAEGRYQDAIEEVRLRQAVLSERRSELEIARQQLLDTTLRSPIDGAVRQRHASAGEYLAAGAPIVTIVRTHPLRLRLSVPERVAVSVGFGQPVHIKVEADPTIYEGRVVRLSPAISEEDRTLQVEAEVPNEHGRLRPGAFAEAEIITTAEERVVFVPASAIVTFAGIDKALTVHDGMSVEKHVQIGRRVDDRVEIIKGIHPGELVVTAPGNLVGGQPVSLRR
jgi:RND family efflux transporter MFP subunit